MLVGVFVFNLPRKNSCDCVRVCQLVLKYTNCFSQRAPIWALGLRGFADVPLALCQVCVLMGWSGADISGICRKQREALTPFNCWAPVMCWKTLSISCSMRRAQCIILRRHMAACHNTCKRTCPWRCKICRIQSSTSVRGGNIPTDRWHRPTQAPLAGHRHHLPGYVFRLLWKRWLVCL